MNQYFLIAVGSALGGVSRHLLTVYLANRAGESFPWGTLVVNLVGSLLIGALAGVSANHMAFAANASARLFLVTGILGGFTTFSAFSVQTLGLIQEHRLTAATLYIGLSVIGGLAAVAGGYYMMQVALRPAS